jgi:spermidine/putrescine-binding protein
MIEEEYHQNAQAQTPTAPPIPVGSSNAAAANEYANQVLSSPAVSAAMTNTPQSTPSALNGAQQHAVSNTANAEAQTSLATSTQ